MSERLTGEPSRKNQWSERDGYHAEPDIELLAVHPERFLIDISVVTRDDWRLLGELSSECAYIKGNFNFSRFDDYLNNFGNDPDTFKRSVEALVSEGILPPQISAIYIVLIELSRRYSSVIQESTKKKEHEEVDLKNKAFLLLLLNIIGSAIYCVSEEGLTAHEFEDNRPPMLDKLDIYLRQMKELYSQYFGDHEPTGAIKYANECLQLYRDGIQAQHELLETRAESLEMRELRNNAIKKFTSLCRGYETLIVALSA